MRASRVLRVLAGVAILGQVAASSAGGQDGPGPAQVNAARRTLAVRVARQMLADVSLPASARRLATGPTDAFAPTSRPADQIFLNASVTRTRYYRAHASLDAVIAAIGPATSPPV